MEWRTRQVGADDQDAFYRVMRVVYRGGDRTGPEDWPQAEDETRFIAEGQVGAAGAFTVEHLRLTCRGAVLAAGGVAAVGVLPEYRHQGVGRSMMIDALAHMREREYVLAALYGFRNSYYRRFGYEVAGRRWQIVCPQHRLPRLATELPVRQVEPDEIEVVVPCYEAFARRLSGSNLRTRAQWRRRLGKRPPLIYAVGADAIEAYAWSSAEGGFWDDLRIGEFCWSTPRGYGSMLAVLTGLCANRSSLTWYEPSASPFLQRSLDQGCQVSLERSAMFRVLDVQSALRILRADGTGEFTLSVEDLLIPQNRGPWRVRFGPDGTDVEPGGEPDLRIPGWALGPAILGEPSLAELASSGVIVGSDHAVKAAARLMSPYPTCLYDFF
jgi:predicted acetyltransferase